MDRYLVSRPAEGYRESTVEQQQQGGLTIVKSYTPSTPKLRGELRVMFTSSWLPTERIRLDRQGTPFRQDVHDLLLYPIPGRVRAEDIS